MSHASKVVGICYTNGHFPTGHVFGITMKNGIELLAHIDIDTINAKDDGFKQPGRKQNDTAKAGDLIIEIDLKKLSQKMKCLSC